MTTCIAGNALVVFEKTPFNDGNFSGWSTSGGTWTATDGVLVNPPVASGYATLVKHHTDSDAELKFSYRNRDTTGNGFIRIYLRTNGGQKVEAQIYKTSVKFKKYTTAGRWETLASVSYSVTEDQWYDVRIVVDGDTAKFYQRPSDGGPEEELMSVTGVNDLPNTSYYNFLLGAGSDFEFDNFRILSDSLSNTTTYAYNDANELTSMTDYNGATTYTYDDWGNNTQRKLGTTYTAD